MWIMTPYGILMPAAVPPELRKQWWNEWNENPEPTSSVAWNMQVRARDRQALIRLRKRMLKSGYEVSAVIDTRHMDYEYRIYVNRHDFATVMAAEIEAIDYEKFKPMTMRKGMGGTQLHDLYNELWGVIARHYDSPILDRYRARRESTKRRDWWDDK